MTELSLLLGGYVHVLQSIAEAPKVIIYLYRIQIKYDAILIDRTLRGSESRALPL